MAYQLPEYINGHNDLKNDYTYVDDSSGNNYGINQNLPSVGVYDYVYGNNGNDPNYVGKFIYEKSTDNPWGISGSWSWSLDAMGSSGPRGCQSPLPTTITTQLNGKPVKMLFGRDFWEPEIIVSAFYGAEDVMTGPFTIPSTVTHMPNLFENCTNFTNFITIDANPEDYTDWLLGTKLPIKVKGESSKIPDMISGYMNASVYVSPKASILVQREDGDPTSAHYHELSDEGTGARITVKITGDSHQAPVKCTSSTPYSSSKTYCRMDDGLFVICDPQPTQSEYVSLRSFLYYLDNDTKYKFVFKNEGTTLLTINDVAVSGESEETRVYHVDGTFSLDSSHTILANITDTWGTSINVADTLTTAFYTIHAKPGGKHIAIGGAANAQDSEIPNNGLLYLYMDTCIILNDCTIVDSGTALSVTAGANTVDGQLAQAIIDAFSYSDAKDILGVT